MPLTTAFVLQRGIQEKVVDAAVATGVAKSQYFVADAMGDQIVTFIAKKTAVTVLTVDVEVSPDGGTTWEKHSTALDFVAQGARRVSIGANQYCRLNIITFTGTSVDIFATSGV